MTATLVGCLVARGVGLDRRHWTPWFAVGAWDREWFRDTTRATYENAPEPKRFETLDSARARPGHLRDGGRR